MTRKKIRAGRKASGRTGDQSQGRYNPGGRTRDHVSGKVYSFRSKHFLLLSELHRLFPDRPPPVDFDRLTPGSESIESVTNILYEDLCAKFEERTFLVFCKLNAERMTDYIQHQLDVGAWPLDPNELLAETYARLFRMHFRGPGASSLPKKHQIQRKPTIFDTLADHIDELIEERVARLRAYTLPLPGLPMPHLSPGKKLVAEARERVDREQFELSEKELLHWVAHALLTLDSTERRILLLRDRRNLSIEQIARELEITALETVRRLKLAQLALKGEIERLLKIFNRSGPLEDDGGEDDHPGGAES